MVKYFKSNEDFFEFINKSKDKVNVIKVEILKTRIKVSYERKKS